MAFISVTRLHLRSKRYALWLGWQTLLIALQTKQSPGNRDLRLLRDPHRAFWTVTAWDDEASMRAFMVTGSHRKVMPKLQEWCDEGAVAHWTQHSPELPSWQEAHRRLVAEGRPVRVRHPSEAHLAYRIPEPGP